MHSRTMFGTKRNRFLTRTWAAVIAISLVATLSGCGAPDDIGPYLSKLANRIKIAHDWEHLTLTPGDQDALSKDEITLAAVTDPTQTEQDELDAVRGYLSYTPALQLSRLAVDAHVSSARVQVQNDIATDPYLTEQMARALDRAVVNVVVQTVCNAMPAMFNTDETADVTAYDLPTSFPYTLESAFGSAVSDEVRARSTDLVAGVVARAIGVPSVEVHEYVDVAALADDIVADAQHLRQAVTGPVTTGGSQDPRVTIAWLMFTKYCTAASSVISDD